MLGAEGTKVPRRLGPLALPRRADRPVVVFDERTSSHRDLRPWAMPPGFVDDRATTTNMQERAVLHVVSPDLAEPGEARPVEVGRVVVSVDGSPFAERALPVATWAAQALGAAIHLVEVVSRPEDSEPAIHYVDGLARRHGVASWDVTQGDAVGAAIAAATVHERPSLACLATHGRDRSATLLGSVAASVLDHTTDPVMLVGPHARPPCASDAPVVVAVDGADDDLALVEVAVSWAATLRTRLVIATVAEPAPLSYRNERPRRRARGPADPERYVAALAAAAAAKWSRCTIDTRVAYDPVSVRDGLVQVTDRTAALLVIGSHRRSLPLRSLFGSHAARVIHDIEIPALVVPFGAGGHGSGS